MRARGHDARRYDGEHDIKKSGPGEVGEEHLFETFDLADGIPPIPDYQVPLYEQLIANIKNPAQRAAAFRAFATRDRRATDAIIHAKVGARESRAYNLRGSLRWSAGGRKLRPRQT